MTLSSWRARARRHLPGIGWRDDLLAERAAQVAALRAEVGAARDELGTVRTRLTGIESALAAGERELSTAREELEAERARTTRPSFLRQLEDFRRMVEVIREVDPDQYHPARQIPFKLRNYRLAASHGVVGVPRVLAVWPDLASVSLDGLPDEFVVKSDVGAGGHGVLPLRRVGPGRYRVAEQAEPVDEAEVRARLAAKGERLKAPFFAEEFLSQPGGPLLPDDVKIYAFYGVVAQVLLRRAGEHGNLRSVTYRYLDETGADLGRVTPGRRTDPSIPVPEELPVMVEVARHLSRAVGVEFCRVDLYATTQGVVLGEITRAPGGPQRYREDHDEWMGALWERARWRLGRDVGRGRPPGVLHGLHPTPNPYPAGHLSQQPDAGAWSVVTVSCDDWCRAGDPGDHGTLPRPSLT